MVMNKEIGWYVLAFDQVGSCGKCGAVERCRRARGGGTLAGAAGLFSACRSAGFLAIAGRVMIAIASMITQGREEIFTFPHAFHTPALPTPCSQHSMTR